MTDFPPIVAKFLPEERTAEQTERDHKWCDAHLLELDRSHEYRLRYASVIERMAVAEERRSDAWERIASALETYVDRTAM